MKKPLLSLCIPTNGIIEWVIPVLDSIYKQNANDGLFEVVISDNGDNVEFRKAIKEYKNNHKNLSYYKSKEQLFLNEIVCYKKAKGEFIKFINHRNILIDGAVGKFINFAKNNLQDKPIVYFSNGALEGYGDIDTYDNFDGFVRRMSYFSSWSSGMAIWKKDLDNLPNDYSKYNELFPHTNILFNERKRDKYIVDNTKFFDEIDISSKNKGKYDFFYAFGVEYPNIILSLLKSGDISKSTFDFVKYRNLGFIGKAYLDYIVLKKETSYITTNVNNIFGIFYEKTDMYVAIVKKAFWKLNKEIRKKMGLRY